MGFFGGQPTVTGGLTAPTNVQMLLQGKTVAGSDPGSPNPISPNSNKIGWNSVVGATSYNIYRSTDGVTYGSAYATGVSGTTFTDSSATVCANGTAGAGPTFYPANTYWYKVSAVAGAAESALSTSHRLIFWQNGTKVALEGDFSFSGLSVDYADTSGGPQGGVADIKCTLSGTFGGFQPYSGNCVSTWDCWLGAQNYLYIDLKPTIPGQTWQLYALRAGDVNIFNSSGVSYNHSLSLYNTPVNGQWATYKVPLTDLIKDWGPSGTYNGGLGVMQNAFYKFAIQDTTGNASGSWYVDNMIFSPI